MAGVVGAVPDGAKLVGVHGSPDEPGDIGEGGLGGVDHGAELKSKNSSMFGCAESRAVRCAELPMN